MFSIRDRRVAVAAAARGVVSGLGCGGRDGAGHGGVHGVFLGPHCGCHSGCNSDPAVRCARALCTGMLPPSLSSSHSFWQALIESGQETLA